MLTLLIASDALMTERESRPLYPSLAQGGYDSVGKLVEKKKL